MHGHSLSCSGLLPLCVLKPKVLQAHPGQQVQLKGRLGGDGHAAWGHTPSVCRVLHQLQSWEQLSHKQGLFLRNWPRPAEHWGLIWTHTDPSHLGALTWTCFPLPSSQVFFRSCAKAGTWIKTDLHFPSQCCRPSLQHSSRWLWTSTGTTRTSAPNPSAPAPLASQQCPELDGEPKATMLIFHPPWVSPELPTHPGAALPVLPSLAASHSCDFQQPPVCSPKSSARPPCPWPP